MLGLSEDWFKSGKQFITLNDFPATSSDLDLTLLDMKLSFHSSRDSFKRKHG